MAKYYQKKLIKRISPFLNFSGASYLTKPLYSGKGQILMLHRVIPMSGRERIHNHHSLEINPELLENIIAYFRRKKYDFISLNNLPEWLINNNKSNRKFVIFTFDDGYKDNLTFAYPVFKKHNVPFTIYITSSFPDGKTIIWWYILEDIILRNSRIKYSFSSGPVNMNCHNYIQKERAYTYVRSLITRLNDTNLENELPGFFDKYGISTCNYTNELILTWTEISDLSKDPLVTIGAHTVNHYNLCRLSDQQSYTEIMESQKLIEAKIQTRVNHFSYPLGQYGKREIEFVKRCNFITATSIKPANIFYNHLDHLLALPRFPINAFISERVLDLITNGFYSAFLHGFKRTVY